MKIEREVLCEVRALEDLADQLLVARAEDDGVVLELGVLPLQPEVDDEQAHAETLALDGLGRRLAAAVVAQQLVVGVDHVAVAGDQTEGVLGAVLQPDAGDAALGGGDAVDRRVQPHLPAQILEQPHHAANEGAGAAAREPHAPLPLQRVDQGVDGGGGEGIAAHQQGVEAEGLPEVRVLDVLGHLVVDRAPGLELGQLGRGAEHLAEAEKGGGPQLDVAFLQQLLGIGQEAAVAFDVGRELGLDLAVQLGLVVDVVEAVAVAPLQPVEGADGQSST
jgi:hypothetical protein